MKAGMGGLSLSPDIADKAAHRAVAPARAAPRADEDFNLGSCSWVEQQGVSSENFERRKDQSFWRDPVGTIPAWDRLVAGMNAEVDLDAQ